MELEQAGTQLLGGLPAPHLVRDIGDEAQLRPLLVLGEGPYIGVNGLKGPARQDVPHTSVATSATNVVFLTTVGDDCRIDERRFAISRITSPP
ncbi:hypothetical protein DBT46_009735, partial [Aerococcus mictus]|uniref:hypothetical protein n=1 Tax=Aerococcus mictus TaxID=2976810 RepID=UPI002FD35076